jgi:hypothetical protein
MLCNLFLLAYQVGYQRDSLGSYSARCKFAEMIKFYTGVGTEKKPAYLVLGDTYRNEKKCREMLFFMAKEVKHRVTRRLRKAQLFGIATDEATDIAMEQGLILYIKFVENGKTVTVFFSMLELVAQDAATIFEAVKTELSDAFDGDTEEMLKNLLTMATDGCSSMMGRKSGVTTRFKELQVRLKTVHCQAHKLALCVKDSADAITEITVLSEHVRDISGLFSRSVKRREGLKVAQEEQGVKLSVITRDVSSRWLSQGACFQRLVENLATLHQFLSEWDDTSCVQGDDDGIAPLPLVGARSNKPAIALQHLESIKFNVMICGANDVLHKINLVSRVLQRRDLTGKEVQIAVQSVIQGLKSCWMVQTNGKITGGPSTRVLLEHFKDAEELEGGGLAFTLSAAGGSNYSYKVKGSEGDHEEAFDALTQFATNIVDNLNERFSDLPDILLFDIFSPSSVPGDEEKRRTFGQDELLKLIDMYGVEKISDGRTYPPIISREVIHEWDLLKELMSQREMLDKGRDKDVDFLASLLMDDRFRVSYPNVKILINIQLILWLSTAECERGFSQRTLLKTKHRASMGNVLLDILMMICSNGPDADDKPGVISIIGAAMQRFKAHLQRHPQRSSTTARKMRKGDRTPLGELEAWAAAVYNEGLDTEVEELVVGGDMTQEEAEARVASRDVIVPNVVVQTAEQRDAAELAAEEAEEKRENAILNSIPAYDPPLGWVVFAALPAVPVFPGVPIMCLATERYLAPKKGGRKEVACKFLGGWERGTVHMQEKSEKKRSKGYFSIKVSGQTGWTLYDLKRETYGTRWVILHKV